MKIILTSKNILEKGLQINSQTIYRGDEAEIDNTNFDPEYGTEVLGRQLGSSMGEGPGMYFTTCPKNAENYGEYISKYIIAPNANLISKNHPKLDKKQIKIIIQKIPSDIVEIASSNWDEDINRGKEILIDNIFDNENIIDQLIDIWAEILNRQDPKMFMEIMKSVGIDGIIVERGNYQNFAIYNLEIIEKII